MAFASLRIHPAEPGAIKQGLAESGWVEGEVLAAGQLRQGKVPSAGSLLTGAALVDVFRPRRSKLLPAHFVLAATPSEVYAFKATGGSPHKRAGPYVLRVQAGVEARFPRDDVRMTDLEHGSESKGGTLVVAGESFPVVRPNMGGDPSTDELIALLGGVS